MLIKTFSFKGNEIVKHNQQEVVSLTIMGRDASLLSRDRMFAKKLNRYKYTLFSLW